MKIRLGKRGFPFQAGGVATRSKTARIEVMSMKGDWDGRAVSYAAATSLFLHILALWALPWQLVPALSAEPPEQIEVEYVRDEPVPEPEQLRFVETNPDVPTNEPDETANIAARNQQAGQLEELTEGPRDTPFVRGEEEEATKIVEGTIQQEVIPVVALTQQRVSSTSDQELPTLVLVVPVRPPDRLQRQPVHDGEGLASVFEDPQEGAQPDAVLQALISVEVPAISQPEEEQQPVEELQVVGQVSDTQTPRPRPRLSTRLLAGPIMRSVGRAPVIANIAVNARFTEFGDYLQRMFDAVGFQFQLLSGQLTPPQSEISTRVIVEYILTLEGEVSETNVIYATAGRAATLICQDAIHSTEPYGPWSEEMIRILGEEQKIRITFIYQ